MLPRLPLAILRALVPRPERDEILADLHAEYAALAAAHGVADARRWLWRQALHSAPALLSWSWWRDWSGFVPHANAYRPGGSMLKTWTTDARYAARRLRARPAYTLLAVLTLALGIGGTAAVFGIARPVLLDPLPYANSGETAVFWMPGWWNEEEFTYMRDKFSGFRSVAAYRPGDATLRQGDGPARLVPGISTSNELFDVLGVRPLLGRGFRKGDDVLGAEPVAVISWGLWQELGGTPAVVGRRLTIDDAPTTVIGVMPRGFWFPDPAVRMWTAQRVNPEGRNGSFALVGLAAPGVDVGHMDAHVARITKTLTDHFHYTQGADKAVDPHVTPLRRELFGSMRPAIVATFVAMGLILLIACANVAALMLGQVEGRATELAVRSALGATRGRITQQLVIEALLVGLGAGLVGAGLAAAGFGFLARALPIGAWSEHAAFDWTTFAVALAIAIAAVLLVVVVPSVSLWRSDLRGALSKARTGGIAGRGGRLERGLVVVEVALAMLIASGAALLVRSVRNLYAIEPGIETKGIAVVDLLSSRRMPSADRGRAIEELTRQLATLPGVTSAATTMRLALRGGGDSFSSTADGHPGTAHSFSYFRVVSRDWLRTMGMKVVAGRGWDGSDHPIPEADTTSELSVLVNEAYVRKVLEGDQAVGRHISSGSPHERIVGVVNDVIEGSLAEGPMPAIYYLGEQFTWWGNQETVVVRAARPGDEAALLDAARRTVNRVAPSFAVASVTTMDRVLDTAIGPARQVMVLLSLLSGLALLLGAVGIYGVISHFAARRQRDWAIRVALGLPGSRVVRHIVGQGAALVAIGVVIGGVATALLARLLASLLFHVGSIDVVAFLGASAALLAIGILAAFVPARRAGTVDPALVLREQ